MHDLARFARRYMGPYSAWYAAGTAALLATNWLSVTIPLYLAEGVDALARGASGRDEVLRAAGSVACMGLAVIGVRTLSRVLYFTPGRLVEAAVKDDLFAAYLRQQPDFLRAYATGDLFSRVSSDVNMLRLLAGFGVLQVVNVVIAVVLAGGQMVAIAPDLALWLLLPIALALGIVQVAIQRMFALLRRLQQRTAAMSDLILSSYRGVATIQAFRAEPAFLQRFDDINDAWLSDTLERANWREVLGPTLGVAASIDVFLLLTLGGPRVASGALTVGELVALTTLVAFITGPLRASSFLVSVVRQAQASLERVDEVLYAPVHRPDLPDPLPAPAGSPALSVHDLTYRYADAAPEAAPALAGLSFHLPAGATLGVMGATGSGKTTLLRLLARLLDPPAGAVRVDGHDVRALDLDGWRDAMTLVPQTAFLFSESVRDNLLLGDERPGRLEAALDAVQLTPDIAALPDGVHTLVGETGVRLSGGQRQRAALARGLLREGTCVLLLDDVLSAVDHATEARLIDTLRKRGDVTTVLVAHRVSALMHADLVLVLDRGRQVDLGSPAELLERPGPFLDTWRHQNAEAS